MLKTTVLLCLGIIGFLPLTKAQDSLTARDAGQVSYRAELLLNEFRDLMNIISNSQTDIKETKDLIRNSYSDSRNRIFFDSTVLIEDDLNPLVRSSASSKDLGVASYLNNFDIFYSKSDTPSVNFHLEKISNLKRGDYLYIKVYFTSLFKGHSSVADSLFQDNRRVAEMRIEKQGNKWAGTIMHIGFLNNTDIASDTLNDVTLVRIASEEAETGGPGGTADANAAATETKTIDEVLKEKERQKQVEAFNQEKKAYEVLVERGDQLIQSGDYASASKVFSDAQELRPYEIYPKLKLAQIRKKAEQSSISANELFAQFISKARAAEMARQYELAKQNYLSAFSQKPEEAEKYADHMRSLNEKIRTLSELGEKFIAGMYKEAIKDYDAAIKKDNSNSDYYLGRARCYDRLNEYSKALKDYSKSIDLDNNNLEALQLRADLYKRNNEMFKAIADYKVYLTVDKSNMVVYTELSDLHVSANNLKAAIEDLDLALSVNARASNVYYKKAYLQLTQNKLEPAIENFSTTIQLDSSATLAYYYRAESRLFSGKVDAAALDFETARSKGLDSVLVYKAEAYARQFSDRSQTFFTSGILDSAIRLISYAILIHPTNPRYRHTRGEYHLFLKHYDEAIKNYDKATGLDSLLSDAFYKKGICYFRLGRYSDAIRNYQVVARQSPKDPMPLKGVGDSYFQLSDYYHTIENLEACLSVISSQKFKMDPLELAQLYNELGKSYSNNSNFAVAIADFKNAIKYNKAFGEAYFNRGYAYYKSGSFSSAIDDLLQALTLENHLSWNYILAQVYKDKGEFANAVSYFSATIKMDSVGELPGLYYERGFCNLQLQNYSVALPDYLKSIELNMASSFPTFNLEAGSLYLNTGGYDSSLLYFKQVQEHDSTNSQALYGIASCYYLKNDLDNSLAWFERLFSQKNFSISTVKKDKLVSGIRDDKRFKALVKKYF
jgi:tetratricopeptide (TPR) repeat protein